MTFEFINGICAVEDIIFSVSLQTENTGTYLFLVNGTELTELMWLTIF